MQETALTPVELSDAWSILSLEERVEGFRLLQPDDAEEFFDGLSARDQAELILAFPAAEHRRWMRMLPPDDAADVLQAAPDEERPRLLALIDDATRREVTALLAYAEDEAGGLMSPRFARIRPDMTVDEALLYLRKQAVQPDQTLYYAYVLDAAQHLLGVISVRGLFTAPPGKLVRDIMATPPISVSEEMDQEAVARVFAEHDLLAVPVVDQEGRMKGVVTVDDIVEVVEEEATEDIQKIGGSEALDAP